MKNHFHCVIFDLDGTLINTAPDVRLALNHTLFTYGQCALSTNEIYALLGGGVRMLIQKAFAKNNVTINAEEEEKAIACYLDFYRAHPVIETTIYPGVVEVLMLLKAADIKLGICTNKPSIMTKIVLSKLKINHFFAAVLAGDEVQKPKPDGDHLREVLNQLSVPPCRAVMVGDSEVDKASAQNAGMPFIGVRYGYDNSQFNHTHMINHFSELPTALAQLCRIGNV